MSTQTSADTAILKYREMDERDTAILAERVTAYDKHTGPRVGDFVRFADGTMRRISHDWGDSVQTSSGGLFYLGKGYASFSGSLFHGVPPETLTYTGEASEGDAWFFHHDHHTAHNGVDVSMGFRVFVCSLEAQSW